MKHFHFERSKRTIIGANGDIPTLLARSGWSPERGYEIYLEDSSKGDELWEMVMSVGEKYGALPSSPNQQRRVEAGMLSFGGDTLADTNALELGLPKKFVDPNGDHDFIGRDALQKIATEGGPQRRFTGIWFLDSILGPNQIWGGKHLPMFGPRSDGTVNGSGTDIGVVTAYAYSPKFSQNLGLGYIKSDISEGSMVGVRTASGNVVAGVVCALPFTSESGKGGRSRK